MKYNKSHIHLCASLFIVFFMALPLAAQEHEHVREIPTLNITNYEYMQESRSSHEGIVTATPIAGTSNWTLKAVPADETKWRFVQWSDGNTDNPRTVSITDLSVTYEAEFHRFITTCISNNEYSLEETNTRGGDVDVTSNGNGSWTLEAIPADDTKWRFREWSDGNTDNPRTVSVTDLSASYEAVFQRFIYTNCYSPEEFMLSNVHNTDTGYITTTQVDGVWQLEAHANAGYTFVQWADGSYVNPRKINVSDITSDEALNFYATFIPSATQGKIDFWRKDGFVLTTSEDEGNLYESEANGAVTVFFDGQLVSSKLPDIDDDSALEERVDPGVYFISADYGTTHELAGKTCHIVYKDNACVPVATLDVTIPVLVDGAEDVVVPNSSTGVHVLNGGVATLSEDQTIADLDIYPGGKAVVSSNVTASSVTMRADAMYVAKKDNPYPVPYPDLLVTGTLTNDNANKINFDYLLDFAAYYPFALPYGVNTANVTYRSGDDARDHFVLGYYDGATRALGLQPAWKTYYDYVGYPADGIDPTGAKDIISGRGYNIFAEPLTWGGDPQEYYGAVIRFPMTVDMSVGGETAKEIAVQQFDGPEVKNDNKNWNLIGLPYLSSYNGTIEMYKDDEPVIDAKTGNTKRLNYITSFDINLQDYHHEFVATTTIYPFHCYLVQFGEDVNKLVFQSPNPSARAAAPAKRKASSLKNDYGLMAGIKLTQNGKYDHTGLFIGEQYTNNYDVNADLAKMIGSTSKVKVFSLLGSRKLAYIAVPPADGYGMRETVIPLGYDSAAVGTEMTFAIDTQRYPNLLEDEDVMALELVDNVDNKTVDLLTTDYTCTAYQKSDNSRFALNVRYRAPQQQEVLTGIEDAPRATALPDGIYDLLGRPLQSATMPAGAYIVVENGKTRKEVIR